MRTRSLLQAGLSDHKQHAASIRNVPCQCRKLHEARRCRTPSGPTCTTAAGSLVGTETAWTACITILMHMCMRAWFATCLAIQDLASGGSEYFKSAMWQPTACYTTPRPCTRLQPQVHTRMSAYHETTSPGPSKVSGHHHNLLYSASRFCSWAPHTPSHCSSGGPLIIRSEHTTCILTADRALQQATTPPPPPLPPNPAA